MRLIILAAIIAAPATASAQDQASEQTVTVRQKAVSVADVMSGRATEPTDKEKDELKETKRHNREMEKRMRDFAKNNPFAFPTKAARQPKAVRHLPPSSNRY